MSDFLGKRTNLLSGVTHVALNATACAAIIMAQRFGCVWCQLNLRCALGNVAQLSGVLMVRCVVDPFIEVDFGVKFSLELTDRSGLG